MLQVEETNAEHSGEFSGLEPEFGARLKSFLNHADSGEHVEFAFGHGFVLMFFYFSAIGRDFIKRGFEIVRELVGLAGPWVEEGVECAELLVDGRRGLLV